MFIGNEKEFMEWLERFFELYCKVRGIGVNFFLFFFGIFLIVDFEIIEEKWMVDDMGKDLDIWEFIDDFWGCLFKDLSLVK